MSWIRDVRADIAALDVSIGNLRKFGLTIGPVLVFIALFFIWRGYWIETAYYLGGAGGLLILSGLLFARALKPVYLVWMGLALAIGWIVSRIILTFLYYIIISPLGLLARLFRKEFLDINFRRQKDSYWIRKSGPGSNYTKMH